MSSLSKGTIFSINRVPMDTVLFLDIIVYFHSYALYKQFAPREGVSAQAPDIDNDTHAS
jgi:ABC-type transport system involved in Fe-S cluster assembly fused permease/ATPase subunit